jgi:hypothetical protein
MGDTLVFHLNLPRDTWLHYYRGRASSVRVRAEDGRTVSLPASALRRFAGHDGVHGRFELRYDQAHRLLDLRRL